MAKEIVSSFKLLIPAGKANPAPPLGPMLGQNGIDIQGFCSEFNDKTRDMGNDVLPVVVTVFEDRSFRMVIKQPTVTGMLLKKIGKQKGSANPSKEKIAKLKREDLREIAEKKLPDFNTKNVESAMSIVAGTARSLGIDIID